MNRIDRLHAIVVHLQSKKKVTAKEIADRFGLSLRTVYRDIKALDESGVPVIGEAGTGYTIMEGYRLPPLMFSREEATALLLGAKFAEGWSGEQSRKYFESALFKIKAVLRSNDKEYVDQLSTGVAVAPSRLPVHEAGGQFLFWMQQAVAQKKVIRMDYHSMYEEKRTTRDIEPIGICHYGTCWHVIGWCRLRNDYRDFRMSRIRKMEETGETFESTRHLTLEEYMQQFLQQSELQEMVVEFDRSVIRYIMEIKYFYGFASEEETDSGLRMKFLVSFPESFGRWLLTFTNTVTIISPAFLRELMQQLSAELKDHH